MSGLKLNTTDRESMKNEIADFIKQHLNLDITPKQVTKIRESICVIEFENELQKKRSDAKQKEFKEH